MNTRPALVTLRPQEIYAMHEARARGESDRQIGERFGRPVSEVQQFLRPQSSTRMPVPYYLHHGEAAADARVAMYWLGFITGAWGRIYHRAVPYTLVLPVARDEVEYLRVLLRDLTASHATYEICHSSRFGDEAYVRDHALSAALLQWGVAEQAPAPVAVEYIPDLSLPHFVRGLLEGYRGPGEARAFTEGGDRVAFVAAPDVVTALAGRMAEQERTLKGTVEVGAPAGAATMRFRGPAARALLAWLYADPLRTSPRAQRLAAAYSAARRTG